MTQKSNYAFQLQKKQFFKTTSPIYFFNNIRQEDKFKNAFLLRACCSYFIQYTLLFLPLKDTESE